MCFNTWVKLRAHFQSLNKSTANSHNLYFHDVWPCLDDRSKVRGQRPLFKGHDLDLLSMYFLFILFYLKCNRKWLTINQKILRSRYRGAIVRPCRRPWVVGRVVGLQNAYRAYINEWTGMDDPLLGYYRIKFFHRKSPLCRLKKKCHFKVTWYIH